MFSSFGLRGFPGRLGTLSLCFRDKVEDGEGGGWMPGGLCAPVDRMLEARGVLKPLCFLTIGTVSVWYVGSLL